MRISDGWNKRGKKKGAGTNDRQGADENEWNGRKARRCECFLKDNRGRNKMAERKGRRREKGINEDGSE